MYIQTVALKEVKFHALHGYYPEEQLIGCHFMVDAEVTFMPNGDTENLSKTVNYEVLNAIIRQEMEHTQKLLETVVKNIIDSIVSTYPFVITAKVGIRKLHPPMIGEIGCSYVELAYKSDR
ncbi:dihydroneopterin aldolase [Pedobacter sp. ASV28]|uniref:dihydroneopterin aldolase n=1 Tax=Pedobacter sp. ASV28 TaxID=2795123 RepID=UPI0018EDA9E1|nr:dihydroneopterin aldolase [Pedobacter sp. ASV28]